MKILVTGAAGMLGRKMVEVLGRSHVVEGTDLAPGAGITTCDLTRRADVEALVAASAADAVVHCAAYTAVDACETEVELAYRVNALATRNVALAARDRRALVCYISTDYVFDGEKVGPYLEHDPTNPLSVYGRTKLAGEEYVRAFADRWCIARIQWLYGEHGPNFAETMLRLAAEKPSLRVVDDQHGTPTYTGDVARQVERLLEAGELGVFHMSNGGQTTWYGFAKAVLAAAGRAEFPVAPCTTEEFPRPAPRPRNSVLRNLCLELTIGDGMRPWEEALAEYMTRRERSAAAGN